MRAALLLMSLLFLGAGPLQAFPGAPGDAEYRAWLSTAGQRARVAEFQRFLARFGVNKVLPIRQLLRTATDWRTCGTPFEVPPATLWPRIIPTLRFIRDEVRPRIGPVEAVSGYRNPRLNQCAGGAPKSAHVGFWGVDLVPASGMSQPELFTRLCALHRHKGRTARFGLGFYGGLRFHVDTKSYRLWGSNHRRGTSPCR